MIVQVIQNRRRQLIFVLQYELVTILWPRVSARLRDAEVVPVQVVKIIQHLGAGGGLSVLRAGKWVSP